MAALDGEAKIEDAVLNGFNPRIAAGKEEQPDAGAKGADLRSSHPPMQLEGDKIILAASGPLPAPQIVLPCRQKGVPRRNFAAVIKLRNPLLIKAEQRSDSATALQAGSAGRRLKENGFIQREARDADGREGKAAADRGTRRVDINGRKRHGAERGKFDAKSAKIVHSLAAYELAADFVMWAGIAFDQDDLASGTREVRGDSAAGDAAPDNQRVDDVRHDSPRFEPQDGLKSE